MKNIKINYKVILASVTVFIGLFTSCTGDDRFDEFRDEPFSPDIPIASFDYEINGQEVTFTNNSTDADSYEWDFVVPFEEALEDFEPDSDPGSSNLENPGTVTYSFDDDDLKVLTVELAAKNSTSNVTNLFVAEISFVDAAFTVSVDEKIASFNNTSLGAVSFSWDFGDGETSTEENPVHEYADFGTYIVTLTSTDSFGNSVEFTNEEVIVVQVGVPTFAAEIINGDFTGSSSAWAANPDNSSGYNFWENTGLEIVLEANGSQHKYSGSSTSNLTPSSAKFDTDLARRAYQPIKIEKDIEYTITAYVKNKAAAAGDIIGTFYILDNEPGDESGLSSSIKMVDVEASETGVWDQVEINFTATSVFNFSMEALTNRDENPTDLTVEDEWVILYFVPDVTTGEINLDDVSIETIGL